MKRGRQEDLRALQTVKWRGLNDEWIKGWEWKDEVNIKLSSLVDEHWEPYWCHNRANIYSSFPGTLLILTLKLPCLRKLSVPGEAGMICHHAISLYVDPLGYHHQASPWPLSCHPIPQSLQFPNLMHVHPSLSSWSKNSFLTWAGQLYGPKCD